MIKSTFNSRALRLAAVLLLAAAAILLVTKTGSDQSSLLFEKHPHAQGVAMDRAFVELMVPEERVRIALAKAACARAGHRALRRFAAGSFARSRAEAQALLAFAGPIDADVPSGLTPSAEQGGGDSGGLGLVPFDAGLSVTATGLRASDRGFEQDFLNRMIRLDQAAVRMTRAVYSGGDVKGLKQLAIRILDRRFAEIFQLNRWYLRWFGQPSRAGGVPAGA